MTHPTAKQALAKWRSSMLSAAMWHITILPRRDTDVSTQTVTASPHFHYARSMGCPGNADRSSHLVSPHPSRDE